MMHATITLRFTIGAGRARPSPPRRRPSATPDLIRWGGLLLLLVTTPGRAWQMKQAPIMTDFAPQVDTNLPLAEYPRPQMVRPDWLCLNGIWQFQPGATNDPVPAGQTLTNEILVPFPMESALSGVKQYHAHSWYRRTFTVPPAWTGRRILLHLDAVDWESEVFINGQSAGLHRGGYDAAAYDITSLLSSNGPQELIVRVFDPTDAAGEPRGKQTLYPGGIMYTSCSGIWQPVWLEPAPATRIDALRLAPDVDAERLRVTVITAGPTTGVYVHAVARIGTNAVGSVTGAPGVELSLPVPDPIRWCPTNPFLYDLTVTLSNGAERVDAVTSYFGMRKIALGAHGGFVKMLLNDEFVFQFGPLDQGFWPDGIYTAPSDLALRTELEMTKALGFNMIRKHIKVEPARWYYWADKLGLLVWQDMPSVNSYTGNPQPIDAPQFETELVRLVQGRGNSPAIVMWVLFNEGQGQHDTAALVAEVKALDPSRLVNEASGGNITGAGDIRDAHSYPNPSCPVSATQAVVCGEFGGVGLAITNHTWASGWGYVGATDADDLAAKFEEFCRQLSDLLSARGLSAAVYTQITDVETELNGLYTYDRKIRKPDLRRMQAAIVSPLAQYAATAVVPTSQTNGQTWKYTTSTPSTNWIGTGFNDGAWSSGLGGFGTASTPGAVVRTTWNTADIWLRRTFLAGALTPQQISNLMFNVHHDEDVEIYLNGVLAGSASGYTTGYGSLALTDAGRAALVPGATNLLAVHCRQTGGGQYIDVGLDVRVLAAPPPPPPPPPAWVENGTGLRGAYARGTNLAAVVLERTDPGIRFDWGTGSPAPALSGGVYSVRWTGQIQPRYSEVYTFHLTADNGCRLWVDNQLLIDRWTGAANVDYAGSIALAGGQRYDLRVEYYNDGGAGRVTLEWFSVSQTRETVPTGVLFADGAGPGFPTSADLPPTGVVTNRAPLRPAPFAALPLGSVRPEGWLRTQCEQQRDGLTGHAETLYAADLGTNSAWLGGTGESWERGPYYCKGLIALAYALNDDGLKQKAAKWMDWLLDHQGPDGYLGPAANNDWWPRMVATYALRDYYEATADARVPTVLSNYFHYMLANLPARPLADWGKARAGDQMDVALWLFNRNGDTNLLGLVHLLRQQAYDWPAIFASNAFALAGTDFHPKHNVNVQQALKMPPVYYQLSGQSADRDAVSLGLGHLMREHGLSCGINSGTEFLSGGASVQGVELCATVEAMLSLETAVRIAGDPALADRLETIAFNALPAGLANDIKGLQYYTLPNNVIATSGLHGFNQDYANGTLPGPNSGFPCCRFNFHMGWPKFVQNAWAATDDGGLAALAYGPMVVTAPIAGEPVRITEDTGYPFEEQIRLRVAVSNAVAFPLVLRIPGWCSNAVVTVNGQAQTGVAAGTFLRLARTWSHGDLVVVDLPMPVRTPAGPSRAVAVQRGPLAYTLRIGENWTVRTSDPDGFHEYEVRPATPWAYALLLNATNPAASLTVSNLTTPANPFDPTQPSVVLRASAQALADWTVGWRGTHAFEPPASPVASTSPVTAVELAPFGSQRLRVSWFPRLGTPAPAAGAFAENFDESWCERWTVFGGNWSARDGKLSLVPASALGAKALATATAFTNFTCEAEVSVGEVGNAGVVFRASRPDIGADAYCGYYVGINAASDLLEFGYASNGWHAITNVPVPIAADTVYRLKVQAIGPRMRVFLADTNQPVIDAQDGHFSGGMIGVRDYCADANRSLASFANLTVTELASPPPGAAPRAWYRLEGDAQDSSGHGLHGAISGGVSFVTGRLGALAAQFSGATGTHVTIPRPISNSFTLAFWVKTTTTGGSGPWYNGKGLVDGEMAGVVNDFGVALVRSNAAFGVGNPDTTIFTTNRINDGSWRHVTATRDSASGQMRLYLDGQLQATTNGPTGTRAAPPNLRLGSLRTAVSGSFLNGAIDDVQIFDRVFSASEVPGLMNHAPELLPNFDAAILAGRTLQVPQSATDPDLPAQTLAFSLVDPPAGATIDPTNGLLAWRPGMAQAGGLYPVAVRVTDNGTPSLSATQQFTVRVLEPAPAELRSPALSNGNFRLSIAGDAGPDYVIEAADWLELQDWQPLATNATATPPFLWTDPDPGHPQRFYRVRLAP